MSNLTIKATRLIVLSEMEPPTGGSEQPQCAGERLPTRRRQLIYLSILVFAIVVVAAVTIFLNPPKDLEGYVRSSGYLGVFLTAIIGCVSPIWPLPGSWAAFIAAGLGLNPLLVALAAGSGEPLGELIAYVGGYGGQVAVTRWERFGQIEGWMKRRGGLAIFLASAIPNFLVKLVVVAAGTLRYSLWRFFVICWTGKIIKSLGFALAGVGLFTAVKEIIEQIL